MGTTSYALLVVKYLGVAFEEINTANYTYLITISSIVAISILNVIGPRTLSYLSLLFGVVSILPFFAFFFLSISTHRVNPSQWFLLPPPHILNDPKEAFTLFNNALSIALWSYSGYDASANITSNLRDANKNLTKSILFTVVISISTYLLTLLSTIGIDSNYSEWHAGSFAIFAEKEGGTIFFYIVVFSAALSNFNAAGATLFPTSNNLFAMGGPHYFNSSLLQFKISKKMPTPIVAISLNCLFCCVCVFIPYNPLIGIANLLYIFIILCLLASFLKLRFGEYGRNVQRKFIAAKYPLSLFFLISAPLLTSLALILLSFISNWLYSLLSFLFFLLLLLLSFLLELCRNKKANLPTASSPTLQISSQLSQQSSHHFPQNFPQQSSQLVVN